MLPTKYLLTNSHQSLSASNFNILCNVSVLKDFLWAIIQFLNTQWDCKFDALKDWWPFASEHSVGYIWKQLLPLYETLLLYTYYMDKSCELVSTCETIAVATHVVVGSVHWHLQSGCSYELMCIYSPQVGSQFQYTAHHPDGWDQPLGQMRQMKEQWHLWNKKKRAWQWIKCREVSINSLLPGDMSV